MQRSPSSQQIPGRLKSPASKTLQDDPSLFMILYIDFLRQCKGSHAEPGSL